MFNGWFRNERVGSGTALYVAGNRLALDAFHAEVGNGVEHPGVGLLGAAESSRAGASSTSRPR
ncbi:hypothetical protein [Mesorhizobium sp. WSM2239]|uniref:Uncharacterized protein n=2 Tax=unclassified Mesorhizobium TaxID=325217 RepID=A0AAU8D862_9HYPH